MTRSYADIADRLIADAGLDAPDPRIRGLLIEAAVQAVGEHVHAPTVTPHEHPFPGNVLQTVDTFAASYGSDGENEARFFTGDLDAAAVVTSIMRDIHTGIPWIGQTHNGVLHRPVIDIDFPIKAIPSSTEGHFHLYIDKPMEWDAYLVLLRALAADGIVEEGYVLAAERRGFTAVRLPWISKADTQREPYCFHCKRRASDIPDVVSLAEQEEATPAQIARGDGTYNAASNRFCCNECYIEIGMPSSPEGWKAP